MSRMEPAGSGFGRSRQALGPNARPARGRNRPARCEDWRAEADETENYVYAIALQNDTQG
jgi:hypothetical protein